MIKNKINLIKYIVKKGIQGTGRVGFVIVFIDFENHAIICRHAAPFLYTENHILTSHNLLPYVYTPPFPFSFSLLFYLFFNWG